MKGMAGNRDTAPAPNELEISILGPGFGETALLHLGSGRWIIVDSCIDTSSRQPAALGYLDAIGVSRSSVDLVIATHWHADHIRGLATIVAECTRAQFCCSSALNNREFLAIANLYADLPVRLSAGPTELQHAFATIIERRGDPKYQPLRWLRSDMVVYSGSVEISGQTFPTKISALSPSDEMITRAHAEMAQQLVVCKKSDHQGLLTPGHPNHISVALHVEVAGRQLLLGSDLEETGDPLVGWSAVLSSTGRPQAAAEVFKVAHHGSKSGHSDAVWSEMLLPNPLALLTPFRWGRHRLPDATDRERIQTLTQKAYITAHPNEDNRPRKREHKVQRMISDTARKRWLAAGLLGHVRWRVDLLDDGDEGVVELFGAAMPLKDVA
jgi:beta-lactamase superfamily II metal-dependent hydrolase